MVDTRVLIVCCILTAFLSACVSKGKYLELESDLVQTRQQAAEGQKKLQTLQSRYEHLETNYRDLEGKNLQLADRVENVTLELKKERSVVEEKNQMIEHLQDTRRRIEAGLKDQIAAQTIKLEEIEGKLKVTFVDKILFNSGSVQINPRGQELLLEFAQSFQDNGAQNIVVEGHTDDVKVGTALKSRFPSNWELSTARAAAVVRFLHERAGLEAERLSATGYGYFRPVASNDSEEGRSQNRRIEILLVPLR
ncbi:MAG: OmpA family protein [Desulfobacterales bacterium]